MKTKTFSLLQLVALLLYVSLSLTAEAVTPAPDGGYAGGNTAEGTNALFSLTSGTLNTALGNQALYHDNIGNANTAIGSQALFNNLSGSANTATGSLALRSNTDGNTNTADGSGALYRNTSGSENTAVGFNALFSNTGGNDNTATGEAALLYNRMGSFNTANGVEALQNNTSGNNNTGIGHQALENNRTGGSNVAVGDEALFLNNGNGNTACGSNALGNNGPASGNTAIGDAALVDNTNGAGNTATGFAALAGNQAGSNNTADGADALLRSKGSNNTALGYNAGSNLTTGGNNIDIGNPGVASEAGTVRMGTAGMHTRAFIAGIRGVMTGHPDAIPVVIDSAGQLGTTSSSRRFKHEMSPMDRASEALLALQPVTFRYKADETNTPQFGLIAEEVAKVNADLVVRDNDGEIYTVRYDAVNAMLLNEFLKEHKAFVQEQDKVEKLETTIAQQQKNFEAAIAELKRRIQKVSTQIEVSKPAPQTVLNNH